MPVHRTSKPSSTPRSRRVGMAGTVATMMLSFASGLLLPAVVAAAQAQCPNPAHDCCTIGTGGCSDLVCCSEVCSFDPFCCATSWDSLCIEHAQSMCTNPCEPGSNCCYAHEGLGCDNSECVDIICTLDRSCCEVEWDNLCAISAAEHCPVCGGTPPFDPCPAAGDCCTAHATPGCDSDSCCSGVCLIDPFCCQTAWDAGCASTAITLCGCPIECPVAEHDCFSTGSPGCSDTTCCSQVCAVDIACCQSVWDSFCVSHAFSVCGLPDCPIECEGTDEGEPCGLITNDGCNTPTSSTSSCCFPWGGVGCDDSTCEAAVCKEDPFCCGTSWDIVCAQTAATSCPELCAYTPLFGSITCGETICGTVWATNGLRDTDWFVLNLTEQTTITVSVESQMPMIAAATDVEDCFRVSGVPVDDWIPICGSSSFNVTLGPGDHWVVVAPDLFDNFPCGVHNDYRLTVTCGCIVGPDRNGDGCVNGADLAIVIGQWDPFGGLGHGLGPGDANCNGVVDGSDLAIILGFWQPICP